MSKFINNGNPVKIFYGITADSFLKRCSQTNCEEDKRAMSYVAALMVSCEPISYDDFNKAYAAFGRTEQFLVSNFKGEVKLNRFGIPFGGVHPALI